jgi:hypothetical protein
MRYSKLQTLARGEVLFTPLCLENYRMNFFVLSGRTCTRPAHRHIAMAGAKKNTQCEGKDEKKPSARRVMSKPHYFVSRKAYIPSIRFFTYGTGIDAVLAK